MKYVGGIVVVAVVAAAGYGIYQATLPPPTTPTPTPTTPTPTPTTPTPTVVDPHIQAARDLAAWIGDETVLTQAQLLEELEWYAKVSEPYRGKSLIVMYEAVPGPVWEEKYLGEWFEKITGIDVKWESMSNYDTILKALEDARTKGGIYDVNGIDQDMNAYFIYNQSGLNITKFLKENPNLVPPHFDPEDFNVRWSYSDASGNLYALHDMNAFAGTVYRKDWFTDPTEQANFKKKYGYDLKTPMEWYTAAMASGNVKDDWTTDKARDVAEFFTRPDKNMYGNVTGVRPGYHMGWYIADGLDDCFQLASPAPEGKWPLECTHLEPNTTPWGIKITASPPMIYGASTKEGGTLDSEAGQACFKWWFEDCLKYTSKKAYEMDIVEAHNSFAFDGIYAFMCPFYFHWAAGTLPGPDSKVRGIFEFAPYFVYAPAYHPRKPRGYIDPSGWVISNYTKNKEMAFIFSSFMTSKAKELKQNLTLGMPVRASTYADPKYTAKDKEWGGEITVVRVHGKSEFGTDYLQVLYPYLLPIARDAGIDALEKKMSGPDIAKRVAADLDKWIKDNGWYKKDLTVPGVFP